MAIYDKAKKVASRVKTAVKSTPKAGKQFGKTLVSEGRKDLRDPSSEASRFARAPLGQYYLPKSAQVVGRVIAPTPGGVYKSQEKAVKKPGPKNIGMAALSAAEVASLGTYGAVARGAGRVAARGLAARGLSLSSEVGAVGKASKINAIQKAMATESLGVTRAPKAGTTAAKAMAAAKADISAEPANKFASLSDDVIRQGLAKMPGSKALIREGQRRGLNIQAAKTGAPDIRPAVGKAMGMSAEKTQVAINRQTAIQIADAGKTLGLSPQQLAVAVKEQGVASVARQLNKAGKLKAAAPAATEEVSLGVERMTAAQKVAAKAKSTRAPGAVKTRQMTSAEKAAFDAPKTSAGFNKVEAPAEALGVSRAPKKVAPAPSVSKATSVAARGVEKAEVGLRDAVRGVLGQSEQKRGSFSGLSKQYGVSRQRVGEIVKMERKRMGITGAPTATMPEAGSAVNAELGVTKAAKVAGRAAKPAVSKAAEAPGTVVAKAGKIKSATPAAEAVTPAVEKAVKVTRKAAGETGAAAVKGKGKFLSKVVARIPKKTAAVAAGAILVANRDKVGIGGGKGSTPAAKTEERAWLAGLPEGLRQDVEALYAVKDQKGEAGLKALVEGLAAAKKDPEWSTEAERRAPHLSDKYLSDYTKLKRTRSSESAKEEIMERVQGRQKKLLRSKVKAAYKK